MRPDDYFTLQLAIGEGTLVFEAAAQKLGEMDQHPEAYKYPGYTALFQVLAGSGNPSYADTIAQYVADTNERISQQAKIYYPFAKEGVARQLVFDY